MIENGRNKEVGVRRSKRTALQGASSSWGVRGSENCEGTKHALLRCLFVRIVSYRTVPPNIPTVKVKDEVVLLARIVVVIIHDRYNNVRCPNWFPFSKSCASKHPQPRSWNGRRCQPHTAHRIPGVFFRSSGLVRRSVIVVVDAVRGRRRSEDALRLVLRGGEGHN